MPRIDGALAHLQRWDEHACIQLNRVLRHAILRHLFRAVSRMGDGILWYSLMLVLLLEDAGSAAIPVAHMLVVGVVCSLVYKLLKQGTLRPRPYEVLRDIEAGLPPLDRFSFPSGHTLHAVAFSVVALTYYPALAPALVPFSALVAASRVVLGLHYPTDVIVGALLGACVAFSSLALV